MVTKQAIKKRIMEVKIPLVINLSMLPRYSELTEAEKIPLRSQQGEISALEYLQHGGDLDLLMDQCLENEWYCGAEGVKRVKEWIAKNK
jgi:hypothetical protein